MRKRTRRPRDCVRPIAMARRRPRPVRRSPCACARRTKAKSSTQDLIQGDVRIKARDIDDLVLLRADGKPTYMLSVVVDDHDMGVTHVIRGDDHLTNAARQIADLSGDELGPRRCSRTCRSSTAKTARSCPSATAPKLCTNGATWAICPKRMNAYLMRLGWSPGHDDILTKEEAVPQFDIAQIGKAPARLDFKKLDSVNAHFMALADDARLTRARCWTTSKRAMTRALSDAQRAALARAIPVLKKRAKTIKELAEQARFLIAEATACA